MILNNKKVLINNSIFLLIEPITISMKPRSGSEIRPKTKSKRGTAQKVPSKWVIFILFLSNPCPSLRRLRKKKTSTTELNLFSTSEGFHEGGFMKSKRYSLCSIIIVGNKSQRTSQADSEDLTESDGDFVEDLYPNLKNDQLDLYDQDF